MLNKLREGLQAKQNIGNDWKDLDNRFKIL